MSTDRGISIVVPCYNRAGYLHLLLQSLTWSSVPPEEFEVIAVDDGGADHLDLVAETWRRQGLDVRVLPLRPGGAPRNGAAARNAGTREARCPIVLQTDPDIVFASDVLRRVRETLAPGVFCSCSGYFPLTRDDTLDLAFGVGGPATRASAYLERATGRPNQVLNPDGVGGLHGGFAIAKEDLLRAGGYDESLGGWGREDRELLVTLAHDAHLERRQMRDTPVVHLWHPPLHAGAERSELAGRGLVSRTACDLQMVRAAAEYPRSRRVRFEPPAEGPAGRPGAFDPQAYADWLDEEPAGSARPLRYQLFFDALRLEATELRVAGHPAIARDLLRYALEHSWDRSPSEWRAYERVDLALEELATCEEALGHLRARDEILGALSSHVDGLARASAVRARGAVRRGDLDAARREVQYLRGTGWTADRAALAIEIALLTDAPRMAARVATTDEERDDVCGDYFERLRLAAYRRLLEHLAPSSALTALGARLGEAADDDSEFLYAAAMRSLRSDLDVAACLLLERFLESGRPAERRLFEDGRRHFDAANERAKRKARKKTLR